MLLSVTGPASEAMRAVFLRTRDDLLVLGCLRGFRSHARACVYLGLLAPFDAALVFFFRRGLEYTSAAAAGAAGPPFPGEISSSWYCNSVHHSVRKYMDGLENYGKTLTVHINPDRHVCNIYLILKMIIDRWGTVSRIICYLL